MADGGMVIVAQAPRNPATPLNLRQDSCIKQLGACAPSFPHAFGGNPVSFLATCQKILDSRQNRAGMTVEVQ